jgi:ABC-type lipoprotein release transport system permease subunit
MYQFHVAARHLRSRSISWVASALIALVMTCYLLVISVMEGQKEYWMDKLQNINAHMTVGVGELAWGIQYPEKWAEDAKSADPAIKGVTIGLESPAMALFDNARTVGTLRGIDLDQELKHGRLKEILFPKDITEFGLHDHGGHQLQGCIVGGMWRRQYELKVGDRVTFLFSDEDGNPRSIAFHIAAFFETKNPYLENGAYIDRKFLADKIGVKGMAKTLYVWLDNPDHPRLYEIRDGIRQKVAAALKRDAPKYEDLERRITVDTWQEKDGGFYKDMTTENLIMRIIMFVFLLMLAFIVFLIFGRLVAEKVRDVGTLRALGATPSGIMQCFLFQALLIGVVGLIVGGIFSFFFISYLNHIVNFLAQCVYTITGIKWSLGDLFGPDRILTHTLPFDIILICSLSIFSALVGALIPAIRAASLNPVECLRHD